MPTPCALPPLPWLSRDGQDPDSDGYGLRTLYANYLRNAIEPASCIIELDAGRTPGAVRCYDDDPAPAAVPGRCSHPAGRHDGQWHPQPISNERGGTPAGQPISDRGPGPARPDHPAANGNGPDRPAERRGQRPYPHPHPARPVATAGRSVSDVGAG